MQPEKKRLFYPDLIRVLATFFVFFYHFNKALMDGNISCTLTQVDAGANVEFGQLGTVLFFILSGFMAVKSFSRKVGDGPVLSKIPNYYYKRFLTIFPMFYIAYAVAFLVFLLPSVELDWRFLYTLIGLDGYITAQGGTTFYLLGEWFTGVIIVFYLVFPFIFMALRKKPILVGIGTLALKLGAIWMLYHFDRPDSNILFYLPDFIIGIYFGLYLKEVNKITGIVSAVVLLVLTIVPMPFTYRIVLTMVGVSGFLVLMFLGQLFEKWECGFARGTQNVIQSVAKYSYACFLTHHIVITVVCNRVLGKAIGKWEYVGLFVLSLLFTAITSVALVGASDHVIGLFQRKKSVK